MYRHLLKRLQVVDQSISIARRSLQTTTTTMAQDSRSKGFTQLNEYKQQKGQVDDGQCPIH